MSRRPRQAIWSLMPVFTVISYGEERPLCTERGEACWARSRRAHFLVKP